MNIAVLKQELKEHIIRELKLEEITADDIPDDAPLFVEGLQLDSIDALELVVILDKFYGLEIKDEETGRRVLYSINTMADFVLEQKGPKS
jgi:acyl carrier protein